jgi:hypothetical protein
MSGLKQQARVMGAVMADMQPFKPASLGTLAQAVADASKAERDYYDAPFDADADDLRDITLFNARKDAELALAAALVMQGVAPALARIMAEALA